MKKRWLPYVIFGLVFYLLFLVIEMPASWFAWAVNRYTGGTVRLDPANGSLWRGSGRLVVFYPPTVPHDFGNAEWDINPLWIFAGRVQVSLDTNTQDIQVKSSLRIGKGKITLRDTDATFSATSVISFYQPASLFGPQGRFTFHTSDFVVGPHNLEGTASLQWLGAISSLSNVQPLGDYHLDIVGDGSVANLKLTTLRGDFEITGQGQWQLINRQLQLTGSAVARKRAEELKPLMQLLGNDVSAGRITFTFTDRLRP